MLKSFADGRLFGGTWGSGTATVLALHGWRRTHQDFAPVFGDGRRRPGVPGAVGLGPVRLRGHAPTARSVGDRAVRRTAPSLFDEPGLLADRIVLVGHSFGGRVAVRCTPRPPDRIERLVLTGVPLLDRAGRRPKPAVAYRTVRRLHRLGLVGETRLEAMRHRYGSPDYRAAEGVMRDVFVKVLGEQYAEQMASHPLSGGTGVGRGGHRGAGRSGRTGRAAVPLGHAW